MKLCQNPIKNHEGSTALAIHAGKADLGQVKTVAQTRQQMVSLDTRPGRACNQPHTGSQFLSKGSQPFYSFQWAGHTARDSVWNSYRRTLKQYCTKARYLIRARQIQHNLKADRPPSQSAPRFMAVHGPTSLTYRT
jgi:uncharacterized membrane protein